VITLDCKNLACPEPVLRTKEAYEGLSDDDILDIELNSFASIENVKRFAESQDIYLKVKSKNRDMTILTLVKGYKCEIEQKKDKNSFYALIAGSLVSAALASTCCLAPLLFLIFGVSMSSLSFLQVFTPYKEYFSLFAILIVIYLWYNYFTKVKKLRVCSTSLCKNHKLYLSVGTITVAILVTYPYWVNYLLG